MSSASLLSACAAKSPPVLQGHCGPFPPQQREALVAHRHGQVAPQPLLRQVPQPLQMSDKVEKGVVDRVLRPLLRCQIPTGLPQHPAVIPFIDHPEPLLFPGLLHQGKVHGQHASTSSRLLPGEAFHSLNASRPGFVTAAALLWSFSAVCSNLSCVSMQIAACRFLEKPHFFFILPVPFSFVNAFRPRSAAPFHTGFTQRR